MKLSIKKPKLTSYQKEFLYCKARFTATEASTKSGKTFSHIYWIYEQAHQPWNKNGYNHWWVAPVYSQAKIAFSRLKNILVKSGVYRMNSSELIIYCPNGAEIHFKTAEKPDNLFGEDVYSIVFDEAPRARVEAWYALRSTITATGGKMKLIGNFGGISNWVHQFKEKAKEDSEYAYFKVTCWDAVREGILKEEEVLQAKSDLPKKVFSALYEAEEIEDEGQLISNEAIRFLFENNDLETGLRYITADIARLGSDKTVIMAWSGFKVVYINTIDYSTIPECVDAIQRVQRLYNVDRNNTIVDEDGVGGGVKDYLKCRGFVNNSKPVKIKGKEENFSNLKTQCYWKLAEMINKGKMYVDCGSDEKKALTEELEWVRLPKEIDTAKISLLSKDKIKEEIGRSPDYSDALMMRMYFSINPNYARYAVR